MEKAANQINHTVLRIPALVRSVAVWALIIVAETVNGTIRELLFVPQFGSLTSRRISFGIALVMIMLISAGTIKWIGVTGSYGLLIVGATWTLLTFLFETVFGIFVMGLSWDTIFADYNIAGGGLMSIGLVFMLFAPLLASRLREDRDP